MERRQQATVFIVDDDEVVLNELHALLIDQGFKTHIFSCAEGFLSQYHPKAPGCLLLDVHMPDISGLELQHTLKDIGSILPIIFMSAHADIPTAVQAMKEGAFDFLQKPVDKKKLLSYIHEALELDAKNRRELVTRQSVLRRIKKLSPREKQVMDKIAAGKTNKLIARELQLSPRTIEIYRTHVMLKMQAKSAIELIKLLDSCQYCSA